MCGKGSLVISLCLRLVASTLVPVAGSALQLVIRERVFAVSEVRLIFIASVAICQSSNF